MNFFNNRHQVGRYVRIQFLSNWHINCALNWSLHIWQACGKVINLNLLSNFGGHFTCMICLRLCDINYVSFIYHVLRYILNWNIFSFEFLRNTSLSHLVAFVLVLEMSLNKCSMNENMSNKTVWHNTVHGFWLRNSQNLCM